MARMASCVFVSSASRSSLESGSHVEGSSGSADVERPVHDWWLQVWLKTVWPSATMRLIKSGFASAHCPVTPKLATTSYSASRSRMASPLPRSAPASKVSAISFRPLLPFSKIWLSSVPGWGGIGRAVGTSDGSVIVTVSLLEDEVTGVVTEVGIGVTVTSAGVAITCDGGVCVNAAWGTVAGIVGEATCGAATPHAASVSARAKRGITCRAFRNTRLPRERLLALISAVNQVTLAADRGGWECSSSDFRVLCKQRDLPFGRF